MSAPTFYLVDRDGGVRITDADPASAALDPRYRPATPDEADAFDAYLSEVAR